MPSTTQIIMDKQSKALKPATAGAISIAGNLFFDLGTNILNEK